MNFADSAATIEELAAGAMNRRPVRSSDAKSGSVFELLTIEGRSCFLKVLDAESDWIMRVTGNTDHWEHKVWRAGVLHPLPPGSAHTILAMAPPTPRAPPPPRVLTAGRPPPLAPPPAE